MKALSLVNAPDRVKCRSDVSEISNFLIQLEGAVVKLESLAEVANDRVYGCRLRQPLCDRTPVACFFDDPQRLISVSGRLISVTAFALKKGIAPRAKLTCCFSPCTRLSDKA